MSVDSYRVRWCGAQAVVTLPDEIDMTNAGEVGEALAHSLEDGAAILVADMTAATFCAAAGVRTLLRANAWAVAAGAQLRVAAFSPAVRRVLELTAADQVLQLYPSLEDALAGHSGAGAADGQGPEAEPGGRDRMERVLSSSQSFCPGPRG